MYERIRSGTLGQGTVAGLTSGAVAGGVGIITKNHYDQKGKNNKNLKTADNL